MQFRENGTKSNGLCRRSTSSGSFYATLTGLFLLCPSTQGGASLTLGFGIAPRWGAPLPPNTIVTSLIPHGSCPSVRYAADRLDGPGHDNGRSQSDKVSDVCHGRRMRIWRNIKGFELFYAHVMAGWLRQGHGCQCRDRIVIKMTKTAIC